MIDILKYLPFSKIYVKTPNIMLIFLYYLLLLACIIRFKRNSIRIMLFVKRNLNKVTRVCICTILIIIIFFKIDFIDLNQYYHFVDVGQGDCTFIRTAFGKNLLVDGGEEEYGKNVLMPYLLDRGVSSIDYMIVSHFDSDHVGGLFYILKNMDVKNVLIGMQYEYNKNFSDFLKLVKEKNIRLKILKLGDNFAIDKSLCMEVLWPPSKKMIDENGINNNSLVFKLNNVEFSCLFTGDIEEIAEREILKYYKNDLKKLNSDVIKVPHHGSNTSSSLDFLEAVQPKVCIIEVGKKNRFGHPNDEIIERYENINCKIYRTDEMGEITIKKNASFLKKHSKMKIYTKL